MLVASLPCQNCGNEHAIQAAHSNWSEHGKGRGIKASDVYTAALCLRCHYELDQGDELTKDERKEMWTTAHRKTVDLLVSRGEWPKGIPVPQ